MLVRHRSSSKSKVCTKIRKKFTAKAQRTQRKELTQRCKEAKVQREKQFDAEAQREEERE
jgi:hypothetical protein